MKFLSLPTAQTAAVGVGTYALLSGWGTNIVSSIFMTFFGIIIFLIGFQVLWLNERKEVKDFQVLQYEKDVKFLLS